MKVITASAFAPSIPSHIVAARCAASGSRRGRSSRIDSSRRQSCGHCRRYSIKCTAICPPRASAAAACNSMVGMQAVGSREVHGDIGDGRERGIEGWPGPIPSAIRSDRGERCPSKRNPRRDAWSWGRGPRSAYHPVREVVGRPRGAGRISGATHRSRIGPHADERDASAEAIRDFAASRRVGAMISSLQSSIVRGKPGLSKINGINSAGLRCMWSMKFMQERQPCTLLAVAEPAGLPSYRTR